MFRKTLALLLLGSIVAAQGTGFADAVDEATDVADEARDDADDFADDAADAAEGVADDADEAADDAADAADEAADAAGEDAAPAEEKAAAPAEPLSLEEQKAEEDLWILLIGISSAVDMVWWIVFGMFVYVQTNAQDSTMFINSDGEVVLVPLGWFWMAVNPFDTTVGWTALNYLWIFLFYMIISIPEFVFWLMMLIERNEQSAFLFNMWASYPGLYGSWILYFFTVLWPIIQLANITSIMAPGYTNAVVQLIMFLITWLFTGIVHLLGFPKVNRMYERDWANAPAKEAAPVEEVAEEVDEETEEPEDEDPVEAADEGEDEGEDAEADDAFSGF